MSDQQSVYLDMLYILEESHRASREAGWWSDLKTGEPIQRNKGEMIALIHSEVSEAWDAWVDGGHDDKLPHRLGVEVELADVIIRIGDYTGGFDVKSLPPTVFGSLVQEATQLPEAETSTPILFAILHSKLSETLEGARRGDRELEARGLCGAIIAVSRLARRLKLDPREAALEKLSYNRQRADHKPENRAQEGGKKF